MADSKAQDAELVPRLIARIAELEEKLYQREFADAEATAKNAVPVQPEQPRLGFLSAIKAGLRQLEESTGYVPPGTYSTQPQTIQPSPRIVYYQAPPQEIVEQMNAVHSNGNSHAQLQMENSQTSNSSAATATTNNTATSAADWISKLTFASSKASTPRDGQQQAGKTFASATPTGVTTPNNNHLSRSPSCSTLPDPSFVDTTPRSSKQQHRVLTLETDSFGSQTLDTAGNTLATPSGPVPQLQPLNHLRESNQVRSSTGDWFYGLFKKDKGQDALASGNKLLESGYNERTADQNLIAAGSVADQQDGKSSYYRYVLDPADIAAEMEVTAKVRKVAAEALMAAEEKLRAAESAQAAMQQQLEQAKELTKEIEHLRQENEQALATRRALEDEMISTRSQLDGMKQTQGSLQEELDSLRTQASIWKDAKSNEQEKLKQENSLLRSQMTTRINELNVLKSKLSEGEADKQRLSRDLEELTGKLQWLTRINAQLENSASQLEDYRKQVAELQEKFMRERAVRRRLHEQLQQLKGNIRVMCRVRPALPNQSSILSYPLEGLLAIHPPDRRPQDFEFDSVFGPDTQQKNIYDEVSPLVRSCADGYNVCIFAYGQTGSGKTFTMEGTEEQPGINVRALQELFSIGAEEGIELNWKVQVSMLEIYNEQIHDLLVPASETVARQLDVSGLGPNELPPNAERVPGATWRLVNSLDDVKQVLKDGSKNRSTAATALNAHSSRSHAVLSVRITAHAQNMSLRSMLHLVDLAGSERIEKSEVSGQQLKEATSINKSLSALGDVISALQRRTPHIPFRNSKLTQVLQDSLSGSSKVLLVCNISPESGSTSETLSSLNFASRAAQVELGQAKRGVEKVITVTDRMQQAAGLPGALHVATSSGPGSNPERTSAGSRTSANQLTAGIRPIRSAHNVSKLGNGATTPSRKESRDSSASGSPHHHPVNHFRSQQLTPSQLSNS